ncbi:hypothetical protein BpHYR1_042982 [Brachionus plicatilis]|uniref:Uncharacterized protein n=1 Tax=Brachionus plicatilis TaxID=10195 RepID=A0A3M7PED1_BRAPC|nr:hypothetical protein BpHYR1_042982 [Brachionus plicatilis]
MNASLILAKQVRVQQV